MRDEESKSIKEQSAVAQKIVTSHFFLLTSSFSLLFFSLALDLFSSFILHHSSLILFSSPFLFGVQRPARFVTWQRNCPIG